MSLAVIAGFCLALVGSDAVASDPLDHADCDSEPTELVCRVLVELEHEFEIYSQGLIEAEWLWPLDWEPLFLGQRILVGSGQVVRAFESSADYHARPGLETPSHALLGTFSPAEVLSRIELVSSYDPVPRVSDDEIDALFAREFGGNQAWAKLMTARILAANGLSERANTLFASLDTGRYTTRAPIASPLHVLWASAGEADAAIAGASALFPVTRGFVELSIAEGLALRGDIDGVQTLINGLPGDLPVLGILPLAEAYRRTGDSQRAKELLDKAGDALSELNAGLRGRGSDIRLAQGYAILGESEAAISTLAPYMNEYDRSYVSDYIAPLIACHDLERALSLIARERFDGTIDYLASQVAELLISAAASGNGEQAFSFAQQEESLVDRTHFLMAVVIGLAQKFNLPDGSPACATRTFLLS